MTKNDLLKRLSDIEWDDFEVKRAETELPKSTWETVSAFANCAGGGIVFGVSQHSKKVFLESFIDKTKMTFLLKEKPDNRRREKMLDEFSNQININNES
jgi:predicted HTH transcriptional regulator